MDLSMQHVSRWALFVLVNSWNMFETDYRLHGDIRLTPQRTLNESSAHSNTAIMNTRMNSAYICTSDGNEGARYLKMHAHFKEGK